MNFCLIWSYNVLYVGKISLILCNYVWRLSEADALPLAKRGPRISDFSSSHLINLFILICSVFVFQNSNCMAGILSLVNADCKGSSHTSHASKPNRDEENQLGAFQVSQFFGVHSSRLDRRCNSRNRLEGCCCVEFSCCYESRKICSRKVKTRNTFCDTGGQNCGVSVVKHVAENCCCQSSKEETSCTGQPGDDTTIMILEGKHMVISEGDIHIILIFETKTYHDDRDKLCWRHTHRDDNGQDDRSCRSV